MNTEQIRQAEEIVDLMSRMISLYSHLQSTAAEVKADTSRSEWHPFPSVAGNWLGKTAHSLELRIEDLGLRLARVLP
jgi:hypothetical protein